MHKETVVSVCALARVAIPLGPKEPVGDRRSRVPGVGRTGRCVGYRTVREAS